jgi:hypothetical protein
LQCGLILGDETLARLLQKHPVKELAAVGHPEDEGVRAAA